MDPEELCSLLADRYPQFDSHTVRQVLKENDYRIGPSSDALEEMSQRQGTSGASSSGQGSFNQRDEREAQIRRDALLARSMQAHSISDPPSYRSGGGGGGMQDDSWTETLNAVSNTVESNLRIAADYASTLGGWASSLIANLDPTTLLFEDDEDYDMPNRPPPDTTKDKEGVSVNRTALTQRSRLSEAPPPPAGHSDEEEEEEEDEEDDSAGAQLAAWLGGEEEVSYAKKDK